MTDTDILSAALLHDTVEDTGTTLQELEDVFGLAVCKLVEEVSDDKDLPKDERKKSEIKHAPKLSREAKSIKLADKICNIDDVIKHPPVKWSLDRRREYLRWAGQVVAGCRGGNPALEAHFDELLRAGQEVLSGIAGIVGDERVG